MSKTKQIKLSPSQEHMQDVVRQVHDKQRLKRWSDLTEEVLLFDNTIGAALMSGRGDLVKAASPRALTAEQAKSLFHMIGVLIETNQALQQHAQQMTELVTQWCGHFKGMYKSARMIESFGHFKPLYNGDDEE